VHDSSLTWLENQAHRETAFSRAHRDSAINWLTNAWATGRVHWTLAAWLVDGASGGSRDVRQIERIDSVRLVRTR